MYTVIMHVLFQGLEQLSLTVLSNLLQDTRPWTRLVERAAWARRFARINSLALRKIVKKHDKLMHSRAGHLFLQVLQLSLCDGNASGGPAALMGRLVLCALALLLLIMQYRPTVFKAG